MSWPRGVRASRRCCCDSMSTAPSSSLAFSSPACTWTVTSPRTRATLTSAPRVVSLSVADVRDRRDRRHDATSTTRPAMSRIVASPRESTSSTSPGAGDCQLARVPADADPHLPGHAQRDVGSLAAPLGEAQTEAPAARRLGALQHRLRARQPLRLGLVEAVRPDVELRRDVLAVLADDGQGLGAALANGHAARSSRRTPGGRRWVVVSAFARLPRTSRRRWSMTADSEKRRSRSAAGGR